MVKGSLTIEDMYLGIQPSIKLKLTGEAGTIKSVRFEIQSRVQKKYNVPIRFEWV